MKKYTVDIYNYTELNDKAKEKAREWYKEGDELPFLPEDIKEHAIELLKENKIEVSEDIKVYYSLSHCQGDGVMIEFTGTWKNLNVTVKQSGHYNHERSTSIDISTEMGDDVYEEVYAEFTENVYVPLCIKLRDSGYDTIESMSNDEFVSDALTVNDYEFYSDGTLYIEK